ncbi:MAG: DUF2807 domain-containing protein [Phenylobacterium sp.]|nr:MAG: DUF2807 domain-containing protein [Phenylobacterium sp.]
MIRVLAMIAVSGFVLATVCLSVAVGLAGPEAVAQGFAWSWGDHDWGDHHGDGRHGWNWTYSHSTTDGPGESRDLAWTGGEALDIDVPAEVTFTQAAGAGKLVVHGPKDEIDHLVVENGHIRFNQPMSEVSDLTIELTAPKITRFALNGSGKLDIHGYRQDALDLNIAGSGEATAEGSAKRVGLTLAGSGGADLAGLATDGADVTISGSGEAKVGPKRWVKLDISGSGNVTLTSHPARQETHISGSGHIEQDDGSDESSDSGDKT